MYQAWWLAGPSKPRTVAAKRAGRGTERSAYVAYLEGQVERVQAACEAVQVQEARLAEAEKRLVGITRLVRTTQSFSEEQENGVRRAWGVLDQRVKRCEAVSGLISAAELKEAAGGSAFGSLVETGKSGLPRPFQREFDALDGKFQTLEEALERAVDKRVSRAEAQLREQYEGRLRGVEAEAALLRQELARTTGELGGVLATQRQQSEKHSFLQTEQEGLRGEVVAAREEAAALRREPLREPERSGDAGEGRGEGGSVTETDCANASGSGGEGGGEADPPLGLMGRIQAQLREIETKMHSQIGELGDLQSKSLENLRQSQQEELRAMHAQTAEINKSVQKLSVANGWGGSEAGTESGETIRGAAQAPGTIPIPPEFASPGMGAGSPTPASDRIVTSIHQCQSLSEQFLALKAEMDENQQRATSLQDVVEELSTALLTKAQEARGLPGPRGLSPSGSVGDIPPMANGVVPLNLNSALANSATTGHLPPSGPIKGESLKDLYSKLNGGGVEQATHGPPETQPGSEGGSPEKVKVAKKSTKTAAVKKVAKVTKTTKVSKPAKTKVTKKN